jgi:hypothetical protein
MSDDNDSELIRPFELEAQPELAELTELPDWKLDDPYPAEEYRDTVNPYPTTDGEQKESAGFPSDRL